MAVKTATKKTVVIGDKQDLNPKKVKEGDIVRFTYWAKVEVKESRRHQTSLGVIDLDTENPFRVDGDSLIEVAYSADSYETEEKVTPTKIAELLLAVGERPFTVVFEKKDGSTRELRGRFISAEEKFRGYAMVEDLDQPSNTHRLRQVDLRTISSLTVNNVRYHI